MPNNLVINLYTASLNFSSQLPFHLSEGRVAKRIEDIRSSKNLTIFYSKLFFMEANWWRVERHSNGFVFDSEGEFDLDSFRSGIAVNQAINIVATLRVLHSIGTSGTSTPASQASEWRSRVRVELLGKCGNSALFEC